jgi:hypothetical protein
MNIDFQTYEKELQTTYIYNPIDISIGFYALCSYQPQAWEYVFQCIRKYYPDAPIVLFNDGIEQYDYTDIAAHYKCIYIRKVNNICLLWNDIGDAYEFLDRTKEACDILKKLSVEWIIHLHPDVICQHKICYHPRAALCGVSAGSITGISNNNFNNSNEWKKIEKYIRQYQPEVEINGWGWCGGSIMNIDIFFKVYDNFNHDVLTHDNLTHDKLNNKFRLEDLRDIYAESVRYEDTMMPIIFTLCGYPYRIWKDNPEYHRHKSITGAFLHGYKEHYDFKKHNISLEDFNKMRIAQGYKQDK